MIKNLLFFFLCFSAITLFAQKTNPIIYGELGLGYAQDFSNKGGLINFGEVNYEQNKNLFSARYSEIYEFNLEAAVIAPFIVFPIIATEVDYNEIALLYGRRFTESNFSYSFSAGISTNQYIQKIKNENNEWIKDQSNFIGVPFELNIKWFKSAKSPYTIYGIIPVGKPTGIGNSIGFKLLGNISKHSYAAIGVVFGIGYHKEY